MLRFTLLVTITLTLCLGCGDSNVTSEGSRLHSTSSQSLVVGQSLEFYFTNTEFDKEIVPYCALSSITLVISGLPLKYSSLYLYII